MLAGSVIGPKRCVLIVVIGMAGGVVAGEIPPMPQAITNNAVASVQSGNNEYLVSFSGLGADKTHEDTLDITWVYDSNAKTWHAAQPVPGGVGRLASVAVSVANRAFVFGGYSVAADGSEVSTPWVHSFDPRTDTFEELTPMPVPVDDAVAVVYEDRFIFLISGWHDLGNVNLVQRYDTRTDTWIQATPIPGPGVFGHAGGIVDGQIVYCDGVKIAAQPNQRREFSAYGGCFLGIIDAEDSRRIDWRTLPPHPGMPRYRMAAAGDEKREGVWFVGGSENPYNYNGIGYNGEASEPVRGALFFNFSTRAWESKPEIGKATMDHRGLVSFDCGFLTIGGMQAGQKLTGAVNLFCP